MANEKKTKAEAKTEATESKGNGDGAQKTEDELLKAMNQLWRRNIKKAAKEGVVDFLLASLAPAIIAATVILIVGVLR